MIAARLLRRIAPPAILAAVALCIPQAASAQTPCPSFEILHNDHIGQLSLPAGHYAVTPIDASRLSCAHASDLFRQFLEDFDGRLPRPWVLDTATATFRRGAGSTTGFTVRRIGGSTGGGGQQHPSTGTSCPGFFTVEHNDHIGRLRIPAGEYRLTLLAVGRLSCERAARLFASFLQDFDGRLPSPWALDVETGTFSAGRNVGFRIKAADGPPVVPSGGNHPGSGTFCTSSFRVQHNDRIGRLRLPAGPYLITLTSSRGITCSRAARLFRSFLNDFDGVLPRPWLVSSRTGTFQRGRGSRVGFRVKPARAR